MIEHFGDMKIHTGNKHDFLGMNIIINEEEETVKIEMKYHLWMTTAWTNTTKINNI